MYLQEIITIYFGKKYAVFSRYFLRFTISVAKSDTAPLRNSRLTEFYIYLVAMHFFVNLEINCF